MILLSIHRRYIAWITLVAVVIGCLFTFDYWQKKQHYAAINAMSWAIASKTIVIDPGHGGEDPGKVSISGTLEKDINLAVAQKLFTILSSGGAQVIVTRNEDKALSGGEETVRERKRADLAARVAIAEESKADLYISLHCNSFPSGRWSGAQTFYSPTVAGSKELATFIQEELVTVMGNTTRKAKADSTSFILKRAKLPLANVEMGFLSNAEEERLLKDPAYQDKLAWAIYCGVVKYLVNYGDKYVPTLQEPVNK